MDLSGKHASNPYRDITHGTLGIRPLKEGIDQILSNYEQKHIQEVQKAVTVNQLHQQSSIPNAERRGDLDEAKANYLRQQLRKRRFCQESQFFHSQPDDEPFK